MRHWMKMIGTALLAGALAASSIPAMAADDQSQPVNIEEKRSQTIDPDRTGNIVISYTDAEGKDPVAGAEFTFYKIGDLSQSAKEHPLKTSEKVKAAAQAQKEAESEVESTEVSEITDAEEKTDKAESAGTSEESEEEAKEAVISSVFTPLIDGVNVDAKIDSTSVTQKVQQAYESGKVKDGKTYKAVTDAKGDAKVDNVELGAYLAVETKAADGYFASISCVLTIPQMAYQNDGLTQFWTYKAALYPKALPAGDLIVEKQLSGNAVERSREFHFKVTFDTSIAKSSAKQYSQNIADGVVPDGFHTADTPNNVSDNKLTNASDNGDYGRTYDRASTVYSYKKSDGSTGSMKSGDTLTLKGGETLQIHNVPAGTAYVVAETEANQDGYKTTVKNDKNTITHKSPQTVTFVNSKNRTETSGASGGSSATRSAFSLNKTKTGDTTSFIFGFIALIAAVLLIVVTRKDKKQ